MPGGQAQTVSYLINTLLASGQAAGSITTNRMQDLPASFVPWGDPANTSGLGSSCIYQGILLANAINYSGNVVTKGAAGSNTVRTATLAALNAGIAYAATNGLLFYIEAGNYEIYGTLAFPSNAATNGFRYFGAGTVNFVQFNTNIPVVTIGSQTNSTTDECYEYLIDGLYCWHGVSQTGNTNANGLVFGQCAYSDFRNIGYTAQFSAGSPTNPAYYGVTLSVGGSSPSALGTFFANTVANIKAQGAQHSLWKLNLNGEGNNYYNLFLNAGSGISVGTTSHAMDLSNYAGGGNSSDAYTKLSIDFCKPLSGNAIINLQDCNGIAFQAVHIEEASQTGGAFIQFASAQATFLGLEFLNTHSRASEGATTAASFFYFYDNEGLSVNGLTMQWAGSGYVDTSFAGVITKGGTDEQPKIFITGWEFSDSAGVVAAHIPQFDPTITSWPTVPDQFSEYRYNGISSKIYDAQFHLTGSATIYGQFVNANVIYPATLSGTPILTLADTMKATGGGSTQKPDANNSVMVRRQAGTFATNLLIKDAGTTLPLTTNSAANSTYYYAFGSTAWAAFT